jgi:hypothetical protein
MTQRIALILSAVLTAFLLVIGGAVAARLSSPSPAAEAAPTATPAPEAMPAPDLNTQAEAIFQEREAKYRALIQQANDRLQQAYAQQTAAQAAANQAAARTATVNTQSTAPAAQPAAAPAVAVSGDAAASIAAGVAYNNQALVRAPELVLFQGQVAYEVVFKHGSIYVDANSGRVLFNGTTNRPGYQTASAPPASGDGDHESDHGDD